MSSEFNLQAAIEDSLQTARGEAARGVSDEVLEDLGLPVANPLPERGGTYPRARGYSGELICGCTVDFPGLTWVELIRAQNPNLDIPRPSTRDPHKGDTRRYIEGRNRTLGS